MEPSIETTLTQTAGREEGFLHYLAREGREFLRWTIGACLIAIVVCMVTIWFAAIVPAVILLVAYVLLVLANEVERRSDVQAHAVLELRESAIASDIINDEAESGQLAPVEAAIIRRESKTAIAIIVSVSLAALLIAAIAFPSPVLAIGAFVVFAYMLLVAAPLWLGWIEDDIEDETHRLQHTH